MNRMHRTRTAFEVPEDERRLAEEGRAALRAQEGEALKADRIEPAERYGLRPLRRRPVKLLPRDAPLDVWEPVAITDSAEVFAGAQRQFDVANERADGEEPGPRLAATLRRRASARGFHSAWWRLAFRLQRGRWPGAEECVEVTCA